MAFLMKASGQNEYDIKVSDLSIKKIWQLLEGYIERVSTEHGVLYINDEARLIGLPFNSDASNMAGITIFGNALHLTREEEQELDKKETA